MLACVCVTAHLSHSRCMWLVGLAASLFRYVSVMCVCVLQSGRASVGDYVFVSLSHEDSIYAYAFPIVGPASSLLPDTC